jgi:glutamate carboxypeptidase
MLPQSYFAAQRGELLAAIAALVGHETPSGDKPRLDALADHLAARFAPLGQIERFANPHGGDHLLLRVAAPGAPADARPALLLCHYDTVWPVGTLARRPFRVEGEVAYGPGAYDMKASIALAEFALRAVAADMPRPALLLLTSDEEIGSPTSRALIEETARAAAHVLVLEPPIEGSWALKTARKGGGVFELAIAGRSAHAGVEPEKGASAVTEMAAQILAINALNDWPAGTTLNVGVAEGGTRPNVVPAAARLEVDARAWSQAESERVTAAMLGLRPATPGVTLAVSGGFRRPPMERTPATAALFARARAVGAGLGLELREGGTGGGSDGNFTAALGVATLDGLGTPGQGAHAEHEQLQIPALFERAALLAALLQAL